MAVGFEEKCSGSSWKRTSLKACVALTHSRAFGWEMAHVDLEANAKVTLGARLRTCGQGTPGGAAGPPRAHSELCLDSGAVEPEGPERDHGKPLGRGRHPILLGNYTSSFLPSPPPHTQWLLSRSTMTFFRVSY